VVWLDEDRTAKFELPADTLDGFTPAMIEEWRQACRAVFIRIVGKYRTDWLTMAEATARTRQSEDAIDGALRTGDLRSLARHDLDAWRRGREAASIIAGGAR
jgi:hypothetical protein